MYVKQKTQELFNTLSSMMERFQASQLVLTTNREHHTSGEFREAIDYDINFISNLKEVVDHFVQDLKLRPGKANHEQILASIEEEFEHFAAHICVRFGVSIELKKFICHQIIQFFYWRFGDDERAWTHLWKSYDCRKEISHKLLETALGGMLMELDSCNMDHFGEIMFGPLGA